jgi:DNA repair exonuclease SbcCD ATPase subunit
MSSSQTPNQLDDLAKRYNEISRQLKSLEEKLKPVTTAQKDKGKLRSLLEDAAKLRQSFDEVAGSRQKMAAAAKPQAEVDRLGEFALFEVLQRKELEGAQSTLVARANTSLNARLDTLEKDVEKFAKKRGGKREEFEQRAKLEQRIKEAEKDIDLIQGALDSLARSSDRFIKDLTSVQQSMTDDLSATLRGIKILLNR